MSKQKRKKAKQKGRRSPSTSKSTPLVTKSGTSPGTAADLISKAKEFESAGKIPESIACLEELLKGQPENKAALERLGRLLSQSKRFEDAERRFRELAQRYPEDPFAQNALAVSLLNLGRGREAAEAAGRAVDLDPNSPVLLANLGKILMVLKDWDRARTCLEKAQELHPDEGKAQTQEWIDLCLSKTETSAADGEESQSLESEFASSPVSRNSGLPAGATAQGTVPAGRTAPRTEGRAALVGSAENEDEKPVRVALCCLEKMDNFVDDLIRALSPYVSLDKIIAEKPEEFPSLIDGYDRVWIEWGNELSIYFTREAFDALKGKRIYCRIHSYEVLDGFTEHIDFSRIDDLIFVAAHIRDILLRRDPEIRQQVKRIHVIPNGVDLDRFKLKERDRGFNIAYVGSLNFKKDPMVLMHAFSTVHAKDPRYRLHIAGNFQNPRYYHAMKHFVETNGLQQAVVYDGWQEDVPGWLSEKQYIICSSLMEGHPVALMEAMATGCKPLIYNFPGAADMFPSEYLWSRQEDLWELLCGSFDSREYRRFVEENYSLKIQAERYREALLNEFEVEPKPFFVSTAKPQQKSVSKSESPQSRNQEHERLPDVEDPTDGSPATWVFPENVFSRSVSERIGALQQEAEKQISAGRSDLAEVSYWRCALMTRYRDERIVHKLVTLYQKRDDIPAIQEIWKRTAIAALEDGRMDQFLDYCYVSIYSEHMYANNPNYTHAWVDEDINAFIHFAARSYPIKERINRPLKSAHYAKDTNKLRVGFLLEGFSQEQAPVRAYYPLAKHHDRNRFDLTYYSRWSLEEPFAQKERYDKTVSDLLSWDCRVTYPKQRMSPMQQVDFLARNILQDDIDVLVYQTTYFVPVYNFLSCLDLVPFQACIVHQQPEYSNHMHLAFGWNCARMECLTDTVDFPISFDRGIEPEAFRREDFGIPDKAVVLISVNREMRYSHETFWKHILLVLERHPHVYFVAVGLSSLDRVLPKESNASLAKERIITPGFRRDVMCLLGMSNIYVNLFPLGAASSVIEAMQAGLPVLTFETDYERRYSVRRLIVASDLSPRTELMIERGNVGKWHQVMDELITNEEFRKRSSKIMKETSKKFDPQTVASKFFEDLANEYGRKTRKP